MIPIRRHNLLATFLVGVAAFGLAPGASAQFTPIDHGTFRLTVGGREAGTETFTIVRSGTGEEVRIIAEGQLDVEGRQVRSEIETTPAFELVAYRATITGDDPAEISLVGGNRLGMRVVSPSGERARELRAREGTAVLEPYVAHLHYFLGRLNQAGSSLPVVVPRGGNDQASLQVLAVTRESVTVAGQALDARRLRLTVDGVERHLWLDGAGRVLRVEIPSAGYVAERVAPPA